MKRDVVVLRLRRVCCVVLWVRRRPFHLSHLLLLHLLQLLLHLLLLKHTSLFLLLHSLSLLLLFVTPRGGGVKPTRRVPQRGGVLGHVPGPGGAVGPFTPQL